MKILKEYYERIVLIINDSINRYFRGEHNLHVRYLSVFALGIFVIFAVFFHSLFVSPRDFPAGILIKIERGATLEEISEMLYEKDAVRSRFVFTTLVTLLAGDRGSLAGDYFFSIPETAWGMAARITRGEYGLDPIRITFPEGVTVAEIADVLDGKLPSFDKWTFVKLSQGKEGYLFPDTYFFLPNVEPGEIIREMSENFDRKMLAVSDSIAQSGKTAEEIIIMASIIEREAITFKDKEIISGILWKRIEIGMRLQVDAPFVYAINKGSFELTRADLKTDSPYNTYTREGLPIGPISNPGIDSVIAAIKPVETPYLFYLSDHYSKMHYAKDFEGHKKNRRLYLD